MMGYRGNTLLGGPGRLWGTRVTPSLGGQWNQQVKLNEKYLHAKFDIYHIYGV